MDKVSDKDYYPLPWELELRPEKDDKDEHGNQEETEKQSLAKTRQSLAKEDQSPAIAGEESRERTASRERRAYRTTFRPPGFF
jgi:hypothetical protein